MPIENINDLEKSLHLDEGTLSKALESEESVSIEIPDLKILKNDDYESLINNVKKESSKQGVELLLKELKEKEGLEFEGRKNPEKFLEAYKEKIMKEVGDEPEKKYKDLKTSFSKLQKNYEELDNNFNGFKQEVQFKEQKNSINNKIVSEIPDNLTIPKEDALALFNLKNKSKLDEDGNIVFLNGENIRKNEVNQNPLSIAEVMKDFITPYIKTPQGGAGGSDTRGGSTPTGVEQFIKEMSDKGISRGSSEFGKIMRERVEAGTLKI